MSFFGGILPTWVNGSQSAPAAAPAAGSTAVKADTAAKPALEKGPSSGTEKAPDLGLPKGKLAGKFGTVEKRGHLTVGFKQCEFTRVKFLFKEEVALEIVFSKKATPDFKAFFLVTDHAMSCMFTGDKLKSTWKLLSTEKAVFPEDVQKFINEKLGFAS